MRISTRHKFIYVSTPKCCTFTVYDILNKHYSQGLIENGFHVNIIPKQFRRFFRWTVVRNPFTRAVSLWWSGCRLHDPDHYGFRKGCGAVNDFTKFIVWLSQVDKNKKRDPLMMSQSEWHRPANPLYTVKLENLEAELQELPFWKPGIVIPKHNTTDEKIRDQSVVEGRAITRPHWKELYKDRVAVDAVIRWAEDDFKNFGYSAEI